MLAVVLSVVVVVVGGGVKNAADDVGTCIATDVADGSGARGACLAVQLANTAPAVNNPMNRRHPMHSLNPSGRSVRRHDGASGGVRSWRLAE